MICQIIFRLQAHTDNPLHQSIRHLAVLVVDQTQQISGVDLVFAEMKALFQALGRSGKIPYPCFLQTQVIIAVGNLSVFASISITVFSRLFPGSSPS